MRTQQVGGKRGRNASKGDEKQESVGWGNQRVPSCRLSGHEKRFQERGPINALKGQGRREQESGPCT